MQVPSLYDRYGPRALILGGSEGIGASFADQLAAQGFSLTLVGRTRASLDETASGISRAHGVDVRVRVQDLTAPDIEQQAEAIIAADDYGLVIYNAGATHGVSLFVDAPVAAAQNLVRLNCVAPMAFAHAALGRMRARGRGGLLLVSSMSGLVGSGYVAAYSATKSFEITLAEALNWEMKPFGVDVTCLVAGLTDTPAMARSGMEKDGAAGFTPMRSEDVAAAGLAALGRDVTCFAVGQQAADAIRTAPRPETIDMMSRAAAALWRVEVQ